MIGIESKVTHRHAFSQRSLQKISNLLSILQATQTESKENQIQNHYEKPFTSKHHKSLSSLYVWNLDNLSEKYPVYFNSVVLD